MLLGAQFSLKQSEHLTMARWAQIPASCLHLMSSRYLGLQVSKSRLASPALDPFLTHCLWLLCVGKSIFCAVSLPASLSEPGHGSGLYISAGTVGVLDGL